MSRFILTVAVLAATVVATSNTTVQAAGKPPSGSSNKSISSNKTISSSNKSYVGTYNGCYRLHNYCGWSRCCWYPNYCCYGYFCPEDGQWYYWCAAQGRYLPVSNMGMYRPTTTGYASPQGLNGATGTMPTLPPGATTVPPASSGGN